MGEQVTNLHLNVSLQSSSKRTTEWVLQRETDQILFQGQHGIRGHCPIWRHLRQALEMLCTQRVCRYIVLRDFPTSSDTSLSASLPNRR